MSEPSGSAVAHRPGRGSLAGLVKACHPGPCVTVTALCVAIGIAVGLDAGRLALLGAAILSGQLSIGWLNDLLDRADDEAAARADKPLVTGLVAPSTVRTALVTATATCVVTSLALGWRPGLTHLLAVAAGWVYDLRLKRTVWSWVPYAVAFGALPAVVVLSVPGGSPPPVWGSLAGALLGVGAHAANALPDIEADRARGIGGLPARLGPVGTRVLAAGCLVLASVVLLVAPDGGPTTASWVTTGGVVVLLAVGLVPRWTRWPRLPFVCVAGAAVLDVALLVGRAADWT